MLIFICFGVLLLISLAFINRMVKIESIRKYEYLAQVICTMGMIFGVSRANWTSPESWEPLPYMLICGLIVCLKFFVYPFIRYRRSKDTAKFLKDACVQISCDAFVFALCIAIYFLM